MNKVIPAVALLLLTAGCGLMDDVVTSNHLGVNHYPPKPLEFEVEKFDNYYEVKEPFEKIAQIFVVGVRPTYEDVVKKSKVEARKFGADAIVLNGMQDGYVTAIKYMAAK